MAKLIGVCEDSITSWERNRNEPSVIYYPKIIQLLGYIPFDLNISIFGGQIKLYRYLNGLTQEELASKLNINESTVFHFETGKHQPSAKVFKKINVLLNLNTR